MLRFRINSVIVWFCGWQTNISTQQVGCYYDAIFDNWIQQIAIQFSQSHRNQFAHAINPGQYLLVDSTGAPPGMTQLPGMTQVPKRHRNWPDPGEHVTDKHHQHIGVVITESQHNIALNNPGLLFSVPVRVVAVIPLSATLTSTERTLLPASGRRRCRCRRRRRCCCCVCVPLAIMLWY